MLGPISRFLGSRRQHLKPLPQQADDQRQTLQLDELEPKEAGLKGFLVTNKIYFETIGALSLTVMAIIVAVAQSAIASRQTELLDIQNSLQKQQVLPQFYMFSHENGKNDEIEINNQGNLAFNVVCNLLTFLELQNTEFPINSYYTYQQYEGNVTGSMITIGGIGNRSYALELQQDFDKIGANNQTLLPNFHIKRYFRLSYRDILGDDHVEYYYVAPIYGGYKLEETAGKEIFEKWHSAADNGKLLEFNNLTAQTLFELLKQVKNDDTTK